MDIPYSGRLGRFILREHRLHLAGFRDCLAIEGKAFGNSRKVGTAEDRFPLVDAGGLELMRLGAVGSVVKHDVQNLDVLALQNLELLNMNQEGVVAFNH